MSASAKVELINWSSTAPKGWDVSWRTVCPLLPFGFLIFGFDKKKWKEKVSYKIPCMWAALSVCVVSPLKRGEIFWPLSYYCPLCVSRFLLVCPDRPLIGKTQQRMITGQGGVECLRVCWDLGLTLWLLSIYNVADPSQGGMKKTNYPSLTCKCKSSPRPHKHKETHTHRFLWVNLQSYENNRGVTAIIKPRIFLPSASIMSHITDQTASWETPASEHTGGGRG